jgi:hypothetical protein
MSLLFSVSLLRQHGLVQQVLLLLTTLLWAAAVRVVIHGVVEAVLEDFVLAQH